MTAAQAPKRPAMERVLATPELFELLVRDFNYKQLFGILRVDRRFRRLILSTPRLLRAMYLQKNVSDTPNDWRLQVLNPLLHNTGEFLTLSPTGSLHFRSSCIRGANESNIFNVMCDFHSNDMDGSLVGGLSKKHPPSWTSMRVASTNVTVAITTIFGFDERHTIALSGEQTMGDVVAWIGKQKRHRTKKLSASSTFGPVSSRQEEEKSDVVTRQDMEPEDTDAMRLQAQRESSALRLKERKMEQLRRRNEREQLERTVTESSKVTVPRPPTAPAQLREVGEDEWSDWERKYILEEPDDQRLRDL